MDRRTLTLRHRIRNRLGVLLHRAGLPAGPMHLLTVPGRRSGILRTTPVAPIVVDGVQYLVQAYPDADWVKNARAGGRGLLRRGRRTVAMRLVEVPQERRGDEPDRSGQQHAPERADEREDGRIGTPIRHARDRSRTPAAHT